MPTKSDLEDQLHQAMRQGDDLRRRTLRMALSAVKLAEVERKGELDESGITKILQREAKSREETIADAKKAGRDDLVAASQAELELLRTYLPEQLSDPELEGLVKQAIAETGASEPSDMGQVMGQLMPQVGARADGKRVSKIVQRMLSEQES